MAIRIRLISHASVLLEADGIVLLTDPWQFGTAFNDSWRLRIPPHDLEPYLQTVDYLWISHEHPDHFHIPTLRSMPQGFKDKVTVLFQKTFDADKMVRALMRLGFAKVVLLRHREFFSLGNGAEAYLYQSRHMDSALAVRTADGTVALNLNDLPLTDLDCRTLRRDLGRPAVVLNQFSIAGYDGVEENLPGLPAAVLASMSRAHRRLKASATIPFASFAAFACSDNRHLNEYLNTPMAVQAWFEREGLQLVVLSPGQVWRVGETWSNRAALAFFERAFAEADEQPPLAPAAVSAAQIFDAFRRMRFRLLASHGRLALVALQPFTVRVPDLGQSFTFSFALGRASQSDDSPDVEIHAQPLHFLFEHPFGLQTLGVSGRYRLLRGKANWLRYRVLMAALNAGFGFAPRHLFSFRQLRFFMARGLGILDQFAYGLLHAFAGRLPRHEPD
jgi:hypothetical protein